MKMERHHELFNRFAWTATNTLESLREDRRLIVPLDPDTHRELHQEVSHVPPLSYHMARHVLRAYSEFEADTYLHNVENLQWSIEEAMQHPRADRIERELGELTMYALDLQKPFIDESLPTRLIRIA